MGHKNPLSGREYVFSIKRYSSRDYVDYGHVSVGDYEAGAYKL